MSSSHHVTSFCCIQTTTSRTIIIQWATLSCSKDKLDIYPQQRARVPSFGAICTTSLGEAHSVFHISEKIALRMCVPAVRCQEEQNLFSLASSACESTMCSFGLMQSSSRKSKQSRCSSEKDLPSTEEVDEEGGREEKKQIWHL